MLTCNKIIILIYIRLSHPDDDDSCSRGSSLGHQRFSKVSSSLSRRRFFSVSLPLTLMTMIIFSRSSFRREENYHQNKILLVSSDWISLLLPACLLHGVMTMSIHDDSCCFFSGSDCNCSFPLLFDDHRHHVSWSSSSWSRKKRINAEALQPECLKMMWIMKEWLKDSGTSLSPSFRSSPHPAQKNCNSGRSKRRRRSTGGTNWAHNVWKRERLHLELLMASYRVSLSRSEFALQIPRTERKERDRKRWSDGDEMWWIGKERNLLMPQSIRSYVTKWSCGPDS